MNITVKSVNWQRNGICGVGFYSIRFEYQDGETLRSMLACLYPENEGYCAIHDLNDLEECWRGDTFEYELKPKLKEYLKSLEKEAI